ncbi:unnamed protein product [Peniophora sp. CBMAI 1063]|nr:unnamed protein product [Peniophora sp. CBMAI 1063]
MASLDPLSSITAALTREHLIPDVLPESFTPSVLFSVIYPNGTEVVMGNELTPALTADEPNVGITPMNMADWQADATGKEADEGKGDVSYTLVMLDPDAPTRAEPIYRSFRHWVVTGLKPASENSMTSAANDLALKTKNATCPYRPPGPRPESGIHRYTFLLFQEPASATGFTVPEGEPEHGTALEERRSWDAVAFGKKHGLKLVGANFFLVRAE